MKTLIITVLVLGVVGALGSIGMQKGFFERSTETPLPVSNSNYVPSEVVEQKPSPFVVLAPGASKIEIYDGIKYDLKVTEIDLQGRDLSGSLKAEIGKLTALRTLDLSGNAFTGLPAEVGQLSQLEVLNLSDNQFTGLPHELGNLQNLKVLDLQGNDISKSDLDTISEQLASSTQILVDVD